ncbi:MAG TPA: hypothetical protein VML75_22870 [Kofleriaceae bacterium]|nr:hypothetical protein [Kofleriaceae bacterium]
MGRALGIGVTLIAAAALVGVALWLRGREDVEAAPAPACEPGGAATITGTVGEHVIAPIQSAWYAEFLAGAYVVVMDEGPGRCGDPSREARHVGIWFPCGRVVPGEVAVRPRDEQTSCETPFASVVLERGTGGDLGSASSGTVVIESTAGCVRGRFDVAFPGGSQLRGSFGAVVCPNR